MAPLPPKVAYEPFGRCMPEAQKVLVSTLMVVAWWVLMFLFSFPFGWGGREGW